MNKNDLLQAIKNFREEQYNREKSTDLITFLYLLASKYEENIFLDGFDLETVVLKTLDEFM